MKSFILVFIGFLTIILISNCEKTDITLRFGETLSNYETDSIYYSKTDGLLHVEYEYDGHVHLLGHPVAKIYSSESIDNMIEIGIVYYSTTVPISKNFYWEVKRLNDNKIYINWTPLE